MLFFAASMTAQTTWTKGQDVTSLLDWKEYTLEDFSGLRNNSEEATEEEKARPWQGGGQANAGHSDSYGTYRLVEMYNYANNYNTANSEIYQVFTLPEGFYTFGVQGFYRHEGAWQNEYWNKTEQIEAVFFVELLEADEDGNPVMNPDGTYKLRGDSWTKEFVSIASSESDQQLYVKDGDRPDWMSDASYTANGTTYYVPGSMVGAETWFMNDYYHNYLPVVNDKTGLVRVGVRKTASISGDWLIFSNFTATYNDNAGEGARVFIAQQKFEEAQREAETYEEIYNEEFPGLGDHFLEDKDGIIDEYAFAETVAEYEEGIAKLKAVVENYKKYYSDAKLLSRLVSLSEQNSEVYAYPGLDTFKAAIAKARSIVDEGKDGGDFVTTTGADYSQALVDLAKARADYAMSQEKVNGAWDFLTVVADPFFCFPKYNPTYDASTNQWIPNNIVLNGENGLKGWSDTMESDAVYNSEDHVRTTDIHNPPSSGEGTEYTWYQYGTNYWTSFAYYYNHAFTSVKHWSGLETNGCGVKQNLSNLPNGYYSVKGMGMTWNNDWSAATPADLGIAITSGGTRVRSQETTTTSGWWIGNTNTSGWNYYSTDMIEVTDGKATVEFFANGFGSFTGMQLLYYGENPDFTALMADKIAKAKAAAELLQLQGDKTYVMGILNQIPATIEGKEVYDNVKALLADAEAYISAANSYLTANDATQGFETLKNQLNERYAADETFRAAVEAAIDAATLHTFDIYNEPATTYEDVVTLNSDLNAYKHYFTTVDNYKAADTSEELATLVNQQVAEMAGTYADAAAIEAYENALAGVYNKNILKNLNMDAASEAKPVDATVLLINPQFNDGKTGWDGDFTVDGTLKNAERYNANLYMSQTLRNLPAGAYEIQVQAFYRDGNIQTAIQHTRFPEVSENDFVPNAKLFANDRETSLVSIANIDANFTERSFTEYNFVTTNPNAEEGQENVEVRAWVEETSDINAETGETTYTVTSWKQQYDNDGNLNEVDANEAWIYDAWGLDGDTRYFFPNSMRGANARFQNDGGAYINKVQVMVEEGGNITLGLKKDQTISDDWIIFDNFKLFYLGTAVPTAIDSVATDHAQAVKIYTVDGRQVNEMQRGINIIKMSDGKVRKVLVK